jgi:uncharacterized damage-inducible protein DinB
MNTKQILLEQMQASHNQQSWFVTMNTAIAGINAEQAAWKTAVDNNSIWRIVNHLIFWNRVYLNRFLGTPNPNLKGDNESSFEGQRTSGTDEQWQAVAKDMYAVMSDWEKALTEASEAKLAEPFSNDSPDPWGSFIALVNIHNAYHIGQIVTLRKQQGSWDKEQGVS